MRRTKNINKVGHKNYNVTKKIIIIKIKKKKEKEKKSEGSKGWTVVIGLNIWVFLLIFFENLFPAIIFWGALNYNLIPEKDISFEIFNSVQEKVGVGR